MMPPVKRDRLYDLTALTFLLGLPIVGVLGVIVPYLFGLPNFSILGIYLAVPMVLAPIFVRSLPAERNGRWLSLRALDWRVPSILIHASIGLLIYLTASVPVRPIWFFVVFAVTYVLLFTLILSGSGTAHTVVSLYHLVATLLVSIFSVTLNYNYFVGREDLPPHHSMALSMYETGTMPEGWEVYEQFAQWHVYVGSTASLLDQWADPYTALVVLSGFIFAAGVLMVYTLANRLLANERIAMLSCLVLIVIPEYVFYGMYSISRSVTSVLFVAFLLTLVASSSPRMRFLRILFIGSIVIYHTVTIPFIAVLLAILYGAERVFSGRPYVVDNFTVLVLGGITAFYWVYRAEYYTAYFVTLLVDMLTNLLSSGTGEGSPMGVFEAPWHEVANYVVYSFLVFFVLVGFFIWLRREHDQPGTFTAFVIASVVMIPLLFPSPVMIVDALTVAAITEARFGHYGFAFVALTGGYGLYALLRWGGKRTFLVLVVLLASFSFVAVSNDFVASDNPVVDRPFYTYYITEQEEETIKEVAEIHEGSLGADYIACHYTQHILDGECEAFSVVDGTINHAEYDGVVIREGEFEKRPVHTDHAYPYVFPEEIPWDELEERNRIHDSGSVSYYR